MRAEKNQAFRYFCLFFFFFYFFFVVVGIVVFCSQLINFPSRSSLETPIKMRIQFHRESLRQSYTHISCSIFVWHGNSCSTGKRKRFHLRFHVYIVPVSDFIWLIEHQDDYLYEPCLQQSSVFVEEDELVSIDHGCVDWSSLCECK